MSVLATPILKQTIVVILLGPPGAGKGTQAEMLQSALQVSHISTGNLLRINVKEVTPLGKEAKRYMDAASPEKVHDCLIRAQDIVAELRSSLNMDAGEVATNLDRSYEYFQHLLILANVRKDPGPIDECVELMTTIRDTWEEVFVKVAQEEGLTQEPQINRHGSTIMNLEG